MPAGVEEGQVAVPHQQSWCAASHLAPAPAILRQQFRHEHRLCSELSANDLHGGRRMVLHRISLQDAMWSDTVYEQQGGVAGLGGHPSMNRTLGIGGAIRVAVIRECDHADTAAAAAATIRVAGVEIERTPVFLMAQIILILKSHVIRRIDRVEHVLLGAVEQLSVEYFLEATQVVVVHNMCPTIVVKYTRIFSN